MIEMAVVGAGPAGMAAAVQCRRAGIGAVLFEKDRLGGLLREANLVENYLGFPGGIPGDDLCNIFQEHVIVQGVEVRREEVMLIEHDGESFILVTPLGQYRSRMLTIATGTLPAAARLGLGADNRRVFDSINHLAGVERLSVAVIGGGDAAYDYSLRLAEKNSVTIISRGPPRCLPLLQQRALDNPSIGFLEGRTVLRSIKAEGSVTLVMSHNGEEESLEFDALLLAIGRVPNLLMIGDSLTGSLESLMNNGLLYMAGDVVNGDRRQAAIAAADGIRAAMSAREAKER